MSLARSLSYNTRIVSIEARTVSRSRPYRSPMRLMSASNKIQIVKNPSQETLQRLGVRSWPTWSCEKSTFPWSYDDTETCYVLKGSATITPTGDKSQPAVTIQAGDLCTFPAGLSCVWKVTEDIQKHYNFS
eukprot:gene13087-14356_t